MLKELQIQNYAIIEKIEVNFSANLNILTGETGAGKSILMGALSLVLGERADTSVLLSADKKCYIEAVFDIKNRKETKEKLIQNKLETDDELIIRREIKANGKSRAFINDSPVTLDILKQISATLVDLHRQFDTLDLGLSDFQRQVVDGLAGNKNLLDTYGKAYLEMQQLKEELQKLIEEKQNFHKEFDYNKFLFDEIEEAAFYENEIEEAEAAIKLLESAEGIRTALEFSATTLEEGEQTILQQLKLVYNQLAAFQQAVPELEAISSRLQVAHIELQDISAEISRLHSKIDADPERLNHLQERLSDGYRLFKKHAVNSTAALLEIKNGLGKKLEAVLNISDQILSVEKELAGITAKAEEYAEMLSKSRKKIIKAFQNEVNELLAGVGMPNARFKVEIKNVPLDSYGKDAIEFLFDGNRSDKFEPVKKVASGGELSRLMLCIKSLVARSVDLPTMIFDEIDTGISGEAAKQVGEIMKELAASRQIIAITHQPQIAGKADAHYLVHKEIYGNSIRTNIRLLNKEENVLEIAKMISGEKPTEAALRHAREMVK